MTHATRTRGVRAASRPRPLSELDCREAASALCDRNSRASAVIVAAMRSMGIPGLSHFVRVDERRVVEGERQIALVTCDLRAPGEYIALIETSRFGFGDLAEPMPASVDVAVLGWYSEREAAVAALNDCALYLRRHLVAPAPVRPPTLHEQARDIAERLAAHALEARTADEPDMDGYVAEATAEIVALLAAVTA